MVACSDNDTLVKLKEEIERIRLAHQKDTQNIRNSIKKDRVTGKYPRACQKDTL